MRLKHLGYYKEKQYGHDVSTVEIMSGGPAIIETIQGRFSFEKNLNTSIPSREELIENTELASGNLNVYTDGSKTGEGTGSGYYCQELHINCSTKLPNECTLFQTELLAIKLTAK